ncbi:MAG: flagellar hook basal-body protein [Candidatus Gastranaerophilales bacterium]|nr:flagellar hook basal-body protein [Candidatus Gastranaerophilales bacterium]
MKLFGGIYFDERGLSTSIRGMHMQTELLSNINNNITGFDKVGFQKEEAVVSSFAEFIGVHALSTVKDDTVGRIYSTNNRLDFALADKGYFQYETPNGIKLTRDGRFKMDKDGHLLTNEGYKVLAADGAPIKFQTVPEDLELVKVSSDGLIQAFNRTTNKLERIASFSVVDKDGQIADKPNVRQGYIESSNVRMEEQMFNLIPVRRNFEANRQLFITQNTLLNRTLQELGKTS